MVEAKAQIRNPVLTEKENTWLLPIEVYVTQEELVQILNKSKDGKVNLFFKPL